MIASITVEIIGQEVDIEHYAKSIMKHLREWDGISIIRIDWETKSTGHIEAPKQQDGDQHDAIKSHLRR